MHTTRRVAAGLVIVLLLLAPAAWARGDHEEAPDDIGDRQPLQQLMSSGGITVDISDDAWEAGVRAGFREIDAALDEDNRTTRESYSFIVTAEGVGERTALIKPFPIANVDIFYALPDYQDARTLQEIPEEARRPLGESGVEGPYARVTVGGDAVTTALAEAESLDDEIKSREAEPDELVYFELVKGVLFSQEAALELGFIDAIKPAREGISFDVHKWRVDDLMLFGNR